MRGIIIEAGVNAMTTSEIELRLSALERQVANLVQKPASDLGINSWIDEIHGTFKNDAYYRDAARFGREWRKGG